MGARRVVVVDGGARRQEEGKKSRKNREREAGYNKHASHCSAGGTPVIGTRTVKQHSRVPTAPSSGSRFLFEATASSQFKIFQYICECISTLPPTRNGSQNKRAKKKEYFSGCLRMLACFSVDRYACCNGGSAEALKNQ
eukprot:gene5030-3624_t